MTGPLHMLAIEGTTDDWNTTIMHPEGCPLAIATVPYFDFHTSGIHYLCAVADEIRNNGFDSMFPEGLEVGFFLVEPWFSKTPSTPGGPAEYDARIIVTPLGITI